MLPIWRALLQLIGGRYSRAFHGHLLSALGVIIARNVRMNRGSIHRDRSCLSSGPATPNLSPL